MRILSIRLHPFGRFSDLAVSFTPGLNVVFGPNEAGKTTLFRAVKAALLVPSRLGKADFQRSAAGFLPLGGDHAAVEMTLEAGDGRYTLRRRWGASPSAELLLPGGVSVSEEQAVGGHFQRILPATEGSLRAVLLAGQAELAGTLATLWDKDSQDGLAARDELAAILRRAVRETGGVSVDRFRRSLDGRIEAMFGRWDRDRNMPEGGRGHTNRWAKGVGEVLAAHYAKEEARAALEAASAFDSDLDEVNRAIAKAEQSLAAEAGFLGAHERTYKDARERGRLESDLHAAQEVQRRLQDAHTSWVASQLKEGGLALAIRDLEGKAAALQKEKREAETAEKAKGLRDKAARVDALAAKAKAARERLSAVRPLDRRQMEEIRKAASAVDLSQAMLGSGRLGIRIRTRRDVRLEIRKDMDAIEALDLAADKTENFEAGLSFGIRHPDFDVTATVRGQEEKAGRSLKEERAKLASLLSACGCADRDAAEAACRAWEEMDSEAERARRSLEEELGGETEEAFRARVAALGPVPTARPPADVAAEAARAEAVLEQSKTEMGRLHEKIRELSGQYRDPGSLLLELAQAAGTEKECRDAMASRAPLPDGYADAGAFIAAYEMAQAKAREAETRLSGLLAKKEALLERAPGRSAEEVAGELATREEVFAAVLSRGKALVRVREAVERLSAGSDEAVFGGLRDETIRLFSAMTGGRWAALDMDEGLPAAARGKDGTAMPRGLLSTGAGDALALALRLAMAGRLLGAQDGFLMMDDPLVDLDPARLEAAAAEIRAFAAAHQTLILTCHPRHAEILGGNRIGM